MQTFPTHNRHIISKYFRSQSIFKVVKGPSMSTRRRGGVNKTINWIWRYCWLLTLRKLGWLLKSPYSRIHNWGWVFLLQSPLGVGCHLAITTVLWHAEMILILKKSLKHRAQVMIMTNKKYQKCAGGKHEIVVDRDNLEHTVCKTYSGSFPCLTLLISSICQALRLQKGSLCSTVRTKMFCSISHNPRPGHLTSVLTVFLVFGPCETKVLAVSCTLSTKAFNSYNT